MNQQKETLLKKILISIMVIISILIIHNSSNAVTVTTPVDEAKFFDTGKMMPANNISGNSGMFPQYFSSPRTVTLDDSRLNWLTNKWQATMGGSVVYCADYGGYVRYAYNDVNNVHWLMPEGTNIQRTTIPTTGESVESQAGIIFSKLREQYYNHAKNNHYYNWISSDGTNATQENSVNRFSATLTYSIPGPKEAVGYVIDESTEGFSKTLKKVQAEGESASNMQSFLSVLGHDLWPSKYSASIDNETYTTPGISTTDGPEVVVMEQGGGQGAEAGYVQSGGTSYSNNAKAFIFSASEEAYGTKEYATEYSLNDIQGAYWYALVDEPEGEKAKTPTDHVTEKARTLYEKAKEYANFNGNFSATINDGKAQVIVDRENKQYIVGPYSITYTDIEDISYMKSLSINNNENLLYDEKHNGIELVLDGGKGSGTIVPGSNGIEKEFPRTGQKFFIKFSAEKAGYPTSVSLDARFEYISSTNATVETKLIANANIYKYYGYSLIDASEHNMATGSILTTFSWPVGKSERYFDWDGTYTEWVDPDTGETGKSPNGEWKTRYWNENHIIKISFEVYMPYVMMEEQYKSGDAQELVVIGEASREYTVVKKSITIDLSMELGGHVWEDGESGKESVYNGKEEDGEKRIPNVIVTLSDGQTTKTDKNGEYRFSGLNAMYQYSVTFTYNGQYYQPTTFSGSSTWGSSEWETNSNAKDSKSEREKFNLKFEKIGSSPENYVGSAGANRTYTKQELMDAGVIDEFGNLIGGDGSMAQYVKDCMMKAYTFDLYPYPSLFVIDNKPVTREYVKAFHNQPAQLYDDAYYINLGLVHREQSDLAIKKDVDHVTLEINGQTHTYTYDTLENKENAENEWDISVRLSDSYYDAAYSRELYKSDYIYKASMYGENFADYGKSKEDELEVYITYKIMVRNQAASIRARVDELVDYYDQDLEYIDERSYIQIKQSRNDAAQKGIYSVKASNNSRYSGNTTTKINGYDNLYVTGLANLSNNDNNNYLAAGQTAYVYLTFKVKKDTIDGEDWVKLDEEIESGNAIGVGKENIVEVNGYTTQYAKGTKVPNVGDVSFKPAGIVDRDSNSGNLADTGIQKDNTNKSVFEKFEDDTDKAPNIRIILYRDDDTTRVISGNVWEDTRNETIGVTTTGDGKQDKKDTLINGVTVQLVELMENGSEYVWREFGDNNTEKQGQLGGSNTIGKGTGSGTVSSETPIINAFNLVKNYDFESKHDGTYVFKSFMPGKYVVRFIYGDTVRTVTPESLKVGGLNKKSYNGQDYKSTTYQEGITQNKTYTWRERSSWNLGQETLGKVLTEVTTFKQDASNNETANAKVDSKIQKGYLYDITASDKMTNVSDAKDIESRRNEVVDYSDNDVTNYIAEVLASHKTDYDTMNDRTQLLNDLMTNTKMIAETGMMVIELEYDTIGTDGNKKDNKYKIQNVNLGLEERAKAQLAIDKEVTNVKLTLADGSILFDAKNTASNVLWKDHKAYNVGYKGNFMDESKFGSIMNIRNKNASKFGLIQLTMDEELMHGATVEITYQVTVSNVGEVDYKDNLFYYTGNKSNNAKVVTTRANQVIDYVANNLQFNSSNNSNWKVMNQDEIKTQGLVNTKLDEQVAKYNTIIVTENLGKELVPSLYKDKVDKNAEDSVSVPLVLTQLITSENDSDDLTYRNLVEIVKTSNTVGRRMEYSVVGNQDPEKAPQELDSDIAEVVRILPPFGNAGIYYIIATITLVVIGMVIVGIIFIKKKVLKK